MELTERAKHHIDLMSYKEMLSLARTTPQSNLWFQGETGEYLRDRLSRLRAQPGGDRRHTEAFEAIAHLPIGWKAF